MSCKKCCFEDFICHCVPYDDVIRINTSLDPGKIYTAVVIDKFDNEYSVDILIGNEGTVEIPIAALPEGLFTEFSGTFRIQIVDGCETIQMPLTALYDCIEIEIKGGTREKNEIGCLSQVGGGVKNAMIPFELVSGIDIYYPSYSQLLGNYPTVQVYKANDVLPPNNYFEIFPDIQYTRDTLGNLSGITIDFGAVIPIGYVLLT